jgi:CHAT domain-containing protein
VTGTAVALGLRHAGGLTWRVPGQRGKSVIGSLWPVSSAHTARMMIVFHHHLRTQEPAEALRSAQLWMLDQDVAVNSYLPKSLTGVRTSGRSPMHWHLSLLNIELAQSRADLRSPSRCQLH